MDGEDRLLWHFPLRRLEAEEVRDSMLWLSGNLNLQMAGPGFGPSTFSSTTRYFYNLVDRSEPEFNRRTVYRMNVQSGRDPLLDSLRLPRSVHQNPKPGGDHHAHSIARPDEQQLRAKARLGFRGAGWSVRPAKLCKRKWQLAWKLAYARTPSKSELERANAFATENGMASLCWVLLNSSELLYVK